MSVSICLSNDYLYLQSVKSLQMFSNKINTIMGDLIMLCTRNQVWYYLWLEDFYDIALCHHQIIYWNIFIFSFSKSKFDRPSHQDVKTDRQEILLQCNSGQMGEGSCEGKKNICLYEYIFCSIQGRDIMLRKTSFPDKWLGLWKLDCIYQYLN